MAQVGNRTLKLEGRRFGRLVARRRLERAPGGYRWLCACDCGTTAEVLATRLTRGNTQSCGCIARKRSTTHGMSGTSLLNRWKAMRQRCDNPNDHAYYRYGGRGITIAAEWRVFLTFVDWADASGYRPELQLDRIDNDGPYSPVNCRWVTAAENARNRRDNRRYEFFGEEMVVKDAARKFGVPAQTITERIDRGITPDLAVTA